MSNTPEDIKAAATAIRAKLCIDCVCTFYDGCGCLDAIAIALLAEREAQRERDAKIAEALLALLKEAADFIQPFNRAEGLLDRIESAIRSNTAAGTPE